jgi:hypothetical protein
LLGAEASASGIEFCFHVGRSQINVPGGRVDMCVAEQGLHHREIDPASASAVPKVCRNACGCPPTIPVKPQ